MNVEIANRLLQLRKEKGLSQEDLAAKLGVTRQAVSKWERAEAAPDTDNLLRLAKLYSVSLDTLLLGGLEDDEPFAAEFTAEPEAKAVLEEEQAEDAYGEPDVPDLKPLRPPEPPRERDPSAFQIHLGDMRFRFKKNQFPYPVVVVIAYFLLGITLDWWHPAWLLFLTIPLYYTTPDFSRAPDRIKALKAYPYPVLVTLVYLCVGIFFGWWHPGWLLFLTIPLYYIFLDHAE
ncbi:MAG TPA: helix-turn-helix transcriptional regulator [Clostridia bacterium]|nr:helix-turn-helix transcriptional regulator [Clostridia bacterium]